MKTLEKLAACVKRRRKVALPYVGVIAVALVVLVGGYGLYRASVVGTVDQTTTSFMDQTADHDSQAFHNALARKWGMLESFAERLRITGADDREVLRSLIEVENQATAFENIELVGTNGTVFTGDGELSAIEDMPWHASYEEADSRFVMRCDASPDGGSDDQGVYIVYGVKLSTPLYLGGYSVGGVVGFIPVDDIAETMRFESFDERGVALVVQPDGAIVTAGGLYDGDESSILERLARARFSLGSYDACERALAEDGSAFASYSLDGENFYAAIKPIEDTDWHLVVRVHGTVTSDVVDILLTRSGLFFAALGVIVVLVAVTIYRSVRSARIARESERAKTAFLSTMSHEIRTPLNGIVGILYLMRQNVDNPEKLQSYLDQANVSANFLKSVISDVLDMSKIESGSVDVRIEPFDLRVMLQELEVIASVQAAGRLDVTVRSVDVGDPFVRGDAVRLKQALVNLLGNAVKFTPDGGEVSLALTEETLDDVAHLVFVVRDTGCGMSDDFLKNRLWSPFEQELRVASQSGTGLGAPLAKAIVEAMGGTVDVRSEVGVGSEFTVRVSLPLASKEEAAELDGRRTDTPAYTLAGSTVLVAEDNDVNRMIVEDILADEGVSVISVENGLEAVERFANSAPGEIDIVLMDVQMPLMDGYGAARGIRGLSRPDARTVPILALTANAFRENVEQALASGMDDVIVKPLNVALLLEKLRDCDSRRSSDS
ncbi:hybrid sensor histidine kinase/response regulator [Xiamenia xianingshaonis]|nr:hybrid sensor histidine kinase/response regulator [Xiamenia xianingshaonis]